MNHVKHLSVALLVLASGCLEPETKTAPPPPDGPCMGDTCGGVDTQTGKICLGCAKEDRVCAITQGQAACQGCIEGRIERDGNCEPFGTCSELACDGANRVCIDGQGQQDSTCGGCVAGYLENAQGTCIPTCAVLHCDEPTKCEENTATGPRCVREVAGLGTPVPQCGSDQAWNEHRLGCQDCSHLSCKEDSETGRLFPVVSNAGRCMCETRDGYFFNPGTLRTESCDADGDGWVKRSAAAAIQATQNCGSAARPCDAALQANARCSVRKVDRFVVTAEDGYTKEILLSEGAYQTQSGVLELFESDINDDLELRKSKGAAPLPVYQHRNTLGGRAFKAAELNTLTKVCVEATADFNANGHSDISEYQGMSPASDMLWTEPFNRLSYFVELYDGGFETRLGEAYGTYRIVARTRLSEAGKTKLPFAFDPSSHESVCYRRVDANFSWEQSADRPNVGMDFAQLNERGLKLAHFGHHTQLRCVQVVDAPENALAQLSAHEVPRNTFAQSQHRLQACAFQGDALACSDVAQSAWDPGMVAWSVAKFQGYRDSKAYKRGCVDECADAALLPVTPVACNLEDPRRTCLGDWDNFGKYGCACPPQGCDATCGEWYLDFDRDGYFNDHEHDLASCWPPDNSGLWHPKEELVGPESVVCDTDATRSPGADEKTCDWLDNNCNGTVDEGHTKVPLCLGNGQCLERDPIDRETELVEICDGVDNDCDEQVDEGFLGAASHGNVFAECALNGKCKNTTSFTRGEKIHLVEICDQKDNNCNGAVDEGFVLNEKTRIKQRCEIFGSCIGTHKEKTDLAEICDRYDNDCDGEIDEGFPNLDEPCSVGIGACYDEGVNDCAGPLTARCDAVLGTRSTYRDYPAWIFKDGYYKATWDLDCDGEVTMQHLNADTPLTMRSISVWDSNEVEGSKVSWRYIIYPDVVKFCREIGAPRDSDGDWFDNIIDINTSIAIDRSNRCEQSHYIIKNHDDPNKACGQSILRIHCSMITYFNPDTGVWDRNSCEPVDSLGNLIDVGFDRNGNEAVWNSTDDVPDGNGGDRWFRDRLENFINQVIDSKKLLCR